ncbi:site-specific DNA-methyltransferase [Candidatus Parcubacteria bacterium]|nr:site-specific DNA-methyltransferase [Candidatus Parcubacteria bacterium]
MLQKFYSKLEKLLKNDSRFIDREGDLLKSNVIDAAYKADKKLIEVLLSQKEFKNKFFSKIKDALVFNINDFVAYISDKNFLADSYTKYRNKIGLNIDEKFLNERNEVALVWPFKDCVLEGGMTKEDEKRKEIFFNEILAQDEIDKLFSPKVLTNWKRYTQKGEEKVKELKRDKDGTIRENLIIKGNNLLALHSLKQQFQNKVKLIYIDPPYNINGDFQYNDSFNHSTWLTFMKNRLEVARELLMDDGVIFVQCDDREHAYLKVLMDEVFKRENFISSMAIKVKAPSGVATGGLIFDIKENILIYGRNNKVEPYNNSVEKEVVNEKSKTIESYNLLFESEGEEGDIVGTFQTQTRKIEIRRMNDYKIEKINLKNVGSIENFYVKNFVKIFRTATLSGGIERKIRELIPDNGLFSYYHTPSKGKYKDQKMKYYVYKKEGILFLNENAEIKQNGRKKVVVKLEQISNIITKDLWQGIAGEGRVELKYGKKPEELLRLIIDLVTKNDDLVLDFFVGTGTTCTVAHKMGRQYVGVEQLDYGKNNVEVRLNNVLNGDQTGISKIVDWKGGGDFVYCELMKYNELFVKKIQKAKDTKTFLKIWEEMKKKSFLNYNVDIKKFDETIDEFKKLSLAKQKRTLFDLLNKNQLYVNLSEIKDKDFKVGEGDKKINKEFYKN